MDTPTIPRVSCIANYAYDASEGDELTIRPGNLIRDVERLPGGWWCGEHHGRRGMFPDNFVSVLNEDKNPRPTVQGLCRAVFCYQPANPDELPLCVGDELEVLGEVEEGWWQGMRQGSVGVFPSNFVVMVDPPPAAHAPTVPPAPPAEPAPALPLFEPAPALPPKPSKEQYRVLFPYTAVNDDELTLAEGDVVTIVSKDAPDRGWWRGELHGRVGLFPDNFVQLLPSVAQEAEEKRPERSSAKASNPIYPILNKYMEKTASVKELTTSKISLHSENTLSNESITQTTVTHTNKSESGKLVHSETVTDGTLETQIKKPPVPVKKSPTPTSAVSGLFSGLKSKMKPSSDKEKSSTNVSSGSSSGGEWDRPDGGAPSKPAATTITTNNTANSTTNATNSSTFDHIERNSILNDPRAGRVKAPRRRPPSQILRDDTPQQIGLSNGHEASDKASGEREVRETREVKPRAREWERHRAPWMEELKLNQAKKTGRAHDAPAAKTGSTDRILDCGLEEKRSTHSMEMSKSTSSISNRISVLESLESSFEGKTRQSMEAKKESSPPAREPEPVHSPAPSHAPVPAPAPGPAPARAPPLHSPTAAGRTLTAMLDEIKKPPAPAPPTTGRTDINSDKSPSSKDKLLDKIITSEKIVHDTTSISRMSGSIVEKSSTMERTEKVEEKLPERPSSVLSGERFSTLERRLHPQKGDTQKIDGTDALIAQLNNRITNLEKLLEVQNAKFNAAIEELNMRFALEVKKRLALQSEMEKLAHCVTQV